jgi:hypothetical protein
MCFILFSDKTSNDVNIILIHRKSKINRKALNWNNFLFYSKVLYIYVTFKKEMAAARAAITVIC